MPTFKFFNKLFHRGRRPVTRDKSSSPSSSSSSSAASSSSASSATTSPASSPTSSSSSTSENAAHKTLTTSTSDDKTLTTLTRSGSPLTLQIYNASGGGGAGDALCATSTLVVGATQVALVDAQLRTPHARHLVNLIKATGKRLTVVFVSHADPHFYFGAYVIRKAFPDCALYATAATVDRIRLSKAGHLARWASRLKKDAPKTPVTPQPLAGDHFVVDGERVEIRGPVPDRTYCWIPCLRTVVGGASVCAANVHACLADVRTPEARDEWSRTLASIEELRPDAVVPAFFYPGAAFAVDAVRFTGRYLLAAEQELQLVDDADEFEAAMKQRYPHLQNEAGLRSGAEALTGEITPP